MLTPACCTLSFRRIHFRAFSEDQVRERPALHYRLPSRRAGSFGTGMFARALEWTTATWFRFEVVLIWLIVVFVTVPSAGDRPVYLLSICLVSPALALGIWILLKLSGIIFYFIPWMNRIWGGGRLLFNVLFSRLVVQEAPTVEWPI